MLDLVAWAERFVATPSVSRDGNTAIATLACELLAEVGVSARLESTVHQGVDQHTVIADLGPKGEDGLLLLTHLDTVPPGEAHAWTATGGDPWRPTRERDRLYGLGSADAKEDLVCKAAALEGLDASELRRPVRVIGSFAEEIGLVGTRWAVEHGLARGYRYALVGEPSELVAIHAHKGYAVYQARLPLAPLAARGALENQSFTGVAAHSSTPALGRNAIQAALARLAESDVAGIVSLEGGGAVNKVPERCELGVVLEDPDGPEQKALDPAPLVAFHAAWCELLQKLETPRDEAFDPAHTVGSLGHIELEDGAAIISFDLRPVPSVDPDRAIGALRDVAQVREVRSKPGLSTPLDSPLVDAVASAQQALGLGRRIGTKATCTEAGLLSRAGLDVLVIGAGRSVGNVHRPNEYTSVAQLAQARDLYRDVVTQLAGDGGAACSS